MPHDVNKFLRACVYNGIIIDANLFLLLAFGTTHKRTKGMDEELKIVSRITKYSADRNGKLILTPHIVSEISNLLINRSKGFDFSENISFMKLIEIIKASVENHVPKDLILGSTYFTRVGFTDLSVLDTARHLGCAVLTTDNYLYCILLAENCQAANPKKIAETKAISGLLSRVQL